MATLKMGMIALSALPMPPSSNHQYRPAKTRFGTRLVCTQDLKDFKSSMHDWGLIHREAIKEAKTRLLCWENCALKVHACFYFKRPKLFTLDSRIKKLDVSNRLKALHDCLCEQLGIDDSIFFQISAEKKEALTESVTIHIEPHVFHPH